MKIEVAREAMSRYYDKEGTKSKRTKDATLNTIHGLDILQHLHDPKTAIEKCTSASKKRKNEEVPYSPTYKNGMVQVLSNIAQNLTEHQMIGIMNHIYDNRSGEWNVSNKMRRHSKEQKINAFKVTIIDEYMAWNGVSAQESLNVNTEQRMSAKQRAAYQPYRQLLEILLALEVLYRTEKNLEVAANLYEYQFIVAGLIWLLAYRNRRNEIKDTMLLPQNGDRENNVYISRADGIILGIFIRECNKTGEPNVLLRFNDERLILAVDTLVNHRIRQGKHRLFLKANGDESLERTWFSTSFKRVMKRLNVGEDLTMGIFRLAYGIKLSEEYEANPVWDKEREICDRMGHSWKTHQHSYNLKAVEEGIAVVESDDEGGEEDEDAHLFEGHDE
ncbi:hypothetical protein HDV00_009684 [Rhizophlyctis rosea]|nr:hypothetical protein HDV00_009684 [Rhizophlyctis rosea]